MSHAEDGEDEIDEGEDAVQPQETVPGGGEAEISSRCSTGTSLVLSTSPVATPATQPGLPEPAARAGHQAAHPGCGQCTQTHGLPGMPCCSHSPLPITGRCSLTREPRTVSGCWRWLSGRSAWGCVLQGKRTCRRLREASAQRISVLAGQTVPVAPLRPSPPTSQDPSKPAAFSSAPQLMEGSFCSLSLCHTPEPPQDWGAPTQEVPREVDGQDDGHGQHADQHQQDQEVPLEGEVGGGVDPTLALNLLIPRGEGRG